jgi:hypothetical protein
MARIAGVELTSAFTGVTKSLAQPDSSTGSLTDATNSPSLRQFRQSFSTEDGTLKRALRLGKPDLGQELPRGERIVPLANLPLTADVTASTSEVRFLRDPARVLGTIDARWFDFDRFDDFAT